QAAWVFRLDANDAPTLLVAACGAEPLEAAAVLATADGPVALAARECRVVLTDDFLADEGSEVTIDAQKTPAPGGSRAFLAVPMVALSRVTGVLVVGDRSGRAFTAEETRLAQAFADHAAVAFENARLYEEAERRRYGGPDLAFAEDLAGRAAQAIDNARLYRTAQEASRAKDEFLATVSHELRTPLTAIIGWTRVLRSRPADAAPIGAAPETIERTARAQAQIINDLLDVSRIITGMLRLNVRPIDLVAVIGEAVAALRPAIDAKALELVTDLHPTAAPFVGDPDRLQQVVWN